MKFAYEILLMFVVDNHSRKQQGCIPESCQRIPRHRG